MGVLVWAGPVTDPDRCLCRPRVTELTERIAWQKRPIRLELSVGQERRVEFPAAVQVGIPGALQPLLRTQSVNGTVYLLAHQAFEATRIMVKEHERGQLYLFDVVASETGGQTHPVQVFVKDSGEASSASVSPSNDSIPSPLGYVTLTRFAAQQLYAPARLLHDVPGIRRIPVARDPIDLVRGGADSRHTPGGLASGGVLPHRRQTHQSNRSAAGAGSPRSPGRLVDGHVPAQPPVTRR